MELFREHPIVSLLETDFYKFTMGQAVLHWFPRTNVKVEFKCRSDKNIGFLKNEIDKELDYICTLKFTEDELNYLRGIPWLKSDYIDYLENFQLKRRHIKTGVDEHGQLTIVAEGPWRDVIYFEIPTLAIVQEIYMKHATEDLASVEPVGTVRLNETIAKFNAKFTELKEKGGFTLSDFGLRRRFSANWQDFVVRKFMENNNGYFIGTSNVYLAKMYGIKPIGTFAHEWFAGIQGESVRLSEVQKVALDTWAKEYRGELGIALSDNFGFRAFLRDFDKYFAKLFDGCRHDSGNPFTWGEMLIEHYKKLKIDPKTKTGCWSDSLDADLACQIADRFVGEINTGFGIGTNITNNTGVKPLSIVMKVVESNGNPVAKISDTASKGMCHDQNYVQYCKDVYQYRSIDE